MRSEATVLHNGKVITLDSTSRIAAAVVVKDGKIIDVGDSASAMKQCAANDRIVDLNGHTVIPGFFDGHPHMDREGLKELGGTSLAGSKTVEEIVAAVAQCVKRRQPGEWVVLMPMGDPPDRYVRSPDELEDRRFPTREDLDRVSPNNPVYIRGIWGWWGTPPFPSIANTYALKLAGVTRDTPAPYRTEIQKDARGEPTGVFLEWNRAPLLEYTLFGKLPRFTLQDRIEGIRIGSKRYSALGSTTGYEGHGLTPEVIRAYREVLEANDLTVRIRAPISVPSSTKSDAELIDLFYQWSAIAGGPGIGDDMLKISGVILDLGDPELATILGAGYPYEQWAGFFYQGLPDDKFIRLGVEAVRAGLRLHSCFCYDLERAIRLYEEIDRQVSIRDMRCVAVHLSNGTDEQLKRIKDLGIGATMAPIILYEHAETFGLDQLGTRALPAREILDAGIPVTLSTDNLPRPSMLWQMWEIMTRHNNVIGRSQGESRLRRDEALRMAVQNGHWLNWEEDRRGSIEIGKMADLVVLDGDPLTCELDALKQIQPTITMVNGRIVYEKPSAT